MSTNSVCPMTDDENFRREVRSRELEHLAIQTVVGQQVEIARLISLLEKTIDALTRKPDILMQSPAGPTL